MLECVELQTTATPTRAVIWLHGLGADGYDFVPLVKELESLGAPAARYVFPHAPLMPVTTVMSSMQVCGTVYSTTGRCRPQNG